MFVFITFLFYLVSSTVLPIPPNTAGIAPSAALFQPPTGPPPVGVLGPQYLPAGLMYGGAARVPPPGTATGFTMPMAYTSPPPTAAGVVGGQPPPLGNVPQQSMHSTAHVSFGDSIEPQQLKEYSQFISLHIFMFQTIITII